MLIIIEGTDKTGKTTLSNYLLKNLPNAYAIKNGFRPKDGSDIEREKIRRAYYKILQTYNLQFKDSILILDRFLLSEFVYSIKRGYDAMKDEDLLTIAAELNNYPKDEIILIYCASDPREIEKKMIEDGEDYAKIGEIGTLLDRYDIALTLLDKVTKVTYDYNRTIPDKVARFIQIKLEEIANEH